MSPYELGKAGEDLAVEYLRREGMQVLEQRWKERHLELDIIAFDPATNEIVFVEVKTRSTGRWGRPEDAIDQNKIIRTVRAAHHYLRLHRHNYEARFDVFAIYLPESGKTHVDYIKDAFYAPIG